MMLWNYIKKHMMLNLQKTISENDVTISYMDLINMSEELAQKIKNEKCCAIYCQSEMYTAVAILACFAANVTVVPLSYRYGSLHCEKLLRRISPTCLITNNNGEFGIYNINDSAYVEPEIKPTLIMCSSGTTGQPKCVMLSDNNILTNLQDIERYFQINHLDSFLISRPLYHCAVLTGELLIGLIKGCAIIFSSSAFNPIHLISIIKKKCISTFCGTPTLFNLMMRFMKPGELTTLKNIVVSGECLSQELGNKMIEYFKECKIYHVYGLTEASPRVTYMPPEDFNVMCASVGVPLDSVKLKITDKNGKKVNSGDDGLLWVKGDNVMLGYYLDAALTKRKIKNGWLCTGDIATLNENGWLIIRGRADDMIIRGGVNIYPAEIENELKKDPRTKDVLAYGFVDTYGDVQIGLKICGDFSVENVRQYCKSVLPPYLFPTKIEIVDELPKSANGKIIRR